MLRLREGGAFYAPAPLQCVAVYWPLLVAGARSGELYHLRVSVRIGDQFSVHRDRVLGEYQMRARTKVHGVCVTKGGSVTELQNNVDNTQCVSENRLPVYRSKGPILTLPLPRVHLNLRDGGSSARF